MSTPYTPAQVEAVFGPGPGDTLEKRALHSGLMFVRSQAQLAHFTHGATGHQLTPFEALEAYGFETLLKVVEDGAAVLVQRPDEPAATLRKQREFMGFDHKKVSRLTHLTVEEVRRAETPGVLNCIQDLERIAMALSLDERYIGTPGAKGDPKLGVRLRQLGPFADRTLNSATVSAIAEAAWIIRRQFELTQHQLSREIHELRSRFTPNENYGNADQPAVRGYDLSEQTRHILGLSDDEPIKSLKRLVEDRLGIPVIQMAIDQKIAGATIVNNGARGILINEKGANANVFVRRMTLAHELGHLLWDPERELAQLRVDRYEDVEEKYFLHSHRDPVEKRANGFAVNLLAPRVGLRAIAARERDPSANLSQVVHHYGISGKAAQNHLLNTLKQDFSATLVLYRNEVVNEWASDENFTVDFIRPKSIPISRRGSFARQVMAEHHVGRLSNHSAALYLGCSVDDFDANLSTLQQLLLSSA